MVEFVSVNKEKLMVEEDEKYAIQMFECTFNSEHYQKVLEIIDAVFGRENDRETGGAINQNDIVQQEEE